MSNLSQDDEEIVRISLLSDLSGLRLSQAVTEDTTHIISGGNRTLKVLFVPCCPQDFAPTGYHFSSPCPCPCQSIPSLRFLKASPMGAG